MVGINPLLGNSSVTHQVFSTGLEHKARVCEDETESSDNNHSAA